MKKKYLPLLLVASLIVFRYTDLGSYVIWAWAVLGSHWWIRTYL